MNRQFILIMADTVRKDMLGCYGNPEMKTPNIDRLCAQALDRVLCIQLPAGLRAGAQRNFYRGVSTFERRGGQLPAAGGKRKNDRSALSDNGIHCGYVGKWHLDGGDYFGNGRCPEGFDEAYWYDMCCYLQELSDEDKRRSRQSATAFDPDWGEEKTYAHRCSDRAIRFLQDNKDTDFFLTVSYDEPHGPCICPPPFNTMYEKTRMPESENYADDLRTKPFMQTLWAGKDAQAPSETLRTCGGGLSLFLGCNSFMDYEVGRVLEVIDRDFPEAIVVFTSDHGDMLGNHRLQMKNAAMYKEIANVPLIVRGGAKGKTISAPASHIDLVPTVLEYMGLPIPRILEGRSMLRQFYDTSIAVNDYVYTEFTRYEVDHDGFGGLQMMRGVTDGRYKLVIHLCDTDEMYDMQSDPAEVNNLIDCEEYAQERCRLHDALLAHMNDTRDVYRGYQWAVRPWRKEKAPIWENDACTRQRGK